jgi:aspartate/methionine/tyrosine aminotransferase
MSKDTKPSASVYQMMSELSARVGAVNLAQGIPEALNDERIKEAVALFLDTGGQYTPIEGDAELRRAIAADYGPWASPEDVIVTSGCTESLAVALIAARGRFGERLAALEPFYSYYPGLARLAGLSFETVPLRFNSSGFTLDLEAIARVLRAGVRILLLNSPHNPSGWVIGQDAWHELVLMVERHDALIVLDEVYRHFIYAENKSCDLLASTGLHGRCLIANAVSKTFAATGMRLGWLLGPPELLREALIGHMHLSNCQPRPLQRAAARLFAVNEVTWRCAVRDHYRTKRDVLFHGLTERGFRCALPDGGHFILADYRPVRDDLCSQDFALWFTHTAGIASMPIDAFYLGGAPKMVRFSFAVSMAAVEQAAHRLARALV